MSDIWPAKMKRLLTRVQIAFAGIEQDILRAKTPGYMRMLTLSHRFVVPMQANKFEAVAACARLGDGCRTPGNTTTGRIGI